MKLVSCLEIRRTRPTPARTPSLRVFLQPRVLTVSIWCPGEQENAANALANIVKRKTDDLRRPDVVEWDDDPDRGVRPPRAREIDSRR